METNRHPVRLFGALGGALLALLALVLALQGGAIAQGTDTDPDFQALTVTAQVPVSDTHPYQGVTKTVYFNNGASGGLITLTVALTGTPPLTLTAGAAFDIATERVYTSETAPAVFEVTYTIGTGDGDQPGVPYTATNGDGAQAVIAVTYTRDITAPTATIVSPAEDRWISTTLPITGTAADNESGSGVARVEVATDTVWVAATGTAAWSYTWTPPAGQNGVPYTLSVRAADYVGNLQSPAVTRLITVDNVMTGTVSNLTSTTHLTGVWSNQAAITVTWSPADDGPGVGLGGYSALWDTSPYTSAPTGRNLTATATATTTALGEGDSHYFHIRALDALGNWAADTVHLGPFKVDVTPPTVAITHPTSGAVLTTTHQPAVTIAGIASDARSGVAWVDVTTSTTWVSATGTTNWSSTWTLPVVDRQVYTLTARAYDNAGNLGISNNVPVTVDTVAPGANVPGPHRSPWVTSTVVYTWAASADGSGVAGYWVNVTNTAGYTALFWTPSPALTFDQASVEGAGYYARVQAVDGAGNAGAWSGSSTVVTPDLTAPTISNPAIVEVSDSFYVSGLTLFYTNTMSSIQTFYVQGNASDGGPSELDKATFSQAFGQTPSDDKYPEVFSGDYDVSPGATESGTITVTVYDRAGNTAVQVYTYTLDGDPPHTGAVTISGGAAYVTQTAVSLALFSADAGCGVAQMCVSNSPSCSAWEGYATAKGWTLEGDDGEKTVYAWFRDHLGNASGPYTDTITLDRLAPTGAITINDGAAYATQVTVTLSLNAADATSGLDGMCISNETPSCSQWETFTATKQWTLDGSADGLRTVYVQYRDRAGNIATYTDTITLDRLAPTVSIGYPSPGAVLTTTQPTVPITGTASDATSGVAWVDVTTSTTWVSATGTTNWSSTWTLPVVDRQVYTLTARAYDNAGNLGISNNVPVTVDTVAPGANVPGPHRSPWVTSTVVYTWTPSTDNSGIAGYRVNITSTAGYTDFFWTTSPVLTFTQALSEGVGYSARVQAVDGAGNAGAWSGPSTVVTPDLTAPTVVVTAPAQIATGTFPISWSASDGSGSGVEYYTVAYREDGGAWQTWIPVTTTMSATFVSGTLEHTYVFRVTAVDRVGNRGEGEATTKVAKWRVYIPLVLRNWVWWYQYDPYEPNDTPAQAYGPLSSGQVITAYIWDATDRDDYYWFQTSTSTTVTITLTNIPANCDFDLYVYHYSHGGYEEVAWSDKSGSVSESVQFTAMAGTKYYIRVYPYLGSSSTHPYRLEVRWP